MEDFSSLTILVREEEGAIRCGKSDFQVLLPATVILKSVKILVNNFICPHIQCCFGLWESMG
jgi:hypothetical protein